MRRAYAPGLAQVRAELPRRAPPLRSGLLQLRRVAGVLHDLGACASGAVSAIFWAAADVALVAAAREREQRAGRASAARARPARARPGRRVRSRPASAAGSWARRPGALRARRAPRPGRRTAAGAPIPRRCPRSAPPRSTRRAARRPRRARRAAAGSSMPAVAADGHEARVARRVAQRGSQGEPPAERVADQQRALARRGDLAAGGPRRCARGGRAATVGGREPLGDGRPRLGGLHEAGDEQDRWSHRPWILNGAGSVSRRGADQRHLRARPGVRRRAGALRDAPRRHVARLAQRAARAHARRRGPSSRRCRCSTSAAPASSRSAWRRRPGGRSPSPAPRARRPRTCIRR